MIEAVSGWGKLWGAFRHQNGLGPPPSGPGPFAFGLWFVPDARLFTRMVDRVFLHRVFENLIMSMLVRTTLPPMTGALTKL